MNPLPAATGPQPPATPEPATTDVQKEKKPEERTYQDFFEVIAKQLRRSGLALSIVADKDMKEDQVKRKFPHVFDIAEENPVDFFEKMESFDLMSGDIIGLALFDSKIYYYPKMFDNIYSIKEKRENYVQAQLKQEKKELKSAKRSGSGNARLLALEKKVAEMNDVFEHCKKLENAVERLLTIREMHEKDLDETIVFRESLWNLREDYKRMLGQIHKLETAAALAARDS